MQYFDSFKIKSAVSASILAATGALAWYLTTRTTERSYYDDKTLIKITKLLNKEMFPVYLDIASKAQKLQEALRQKGKDPTNELFSKMIKEQVFDKSNS